MGRVGARSLAVVAAGLLAACGGRATTAPSPTPSVEAARPPSASVAPASPTETTLQASGVALATPQPTHDWDEAPTAATDPDGLANQLVVAETGIRDPNVMGAQLVWMGHLEQVAIDRIVDQPQLRDVVVAGLPDGMRRPVDAAIEASMQLRAMHRVWPKTLPDWTIIDPAPAAKLLAYYQEAEVVYGVPWYYLASINLVETRMGRIRGDSSAGAQGPMQFIPSTWARYGQGDVQDPHDAILAAARYLKAAGAPGDMSRAIFAYNHSQLYVNAITGYAEVMHADPNAFRGYYGWQVYYHTVDGSFWLKTGWHKEQQ